ncbi:SGNH/GDSL hydrolase family protein [Ornithinimicrobium avium]|uniref:SGNH/GDSL hydrolase family protein n=1 Tax=Ornithinimicrobium avium TaxID=2283195 RepID=A0A345NLY1_9MICO|nr:SGNH/GDSL hydrolase family protein [Ornithinimicrobium avium]AXH96039.1 SGNH/GDSL hydrolase family protein [Ornithinimicrobium avium]
MDSRVAGRIRLTAVALSTFALSVGSVLPGNAAPKTYDYDALGDSFAAGTGVDPSQAYPNVLDGRMKIALDDFVAVSGATVQTMLTGQLGTLDEDTDVVTITVGGNDIEWGQVVLACLARPDPVCAAAVAQVEQGITAGLPALLEAAYTQVRAAAPDAHVVVTGYPRLFSPEYGAYTVPLSPDSSLEASVAEQQMMNDAADLLNATIRTTAEAHGFQFVDVTRRFKGHGVNSPDAYLFGVLDPAPFHPNVDGQHEYGVALRSQINPNSLRR